MNMESSALKTSVDTDGVDDDNRADGKLYTSKTTWKNLLILSVSYTVVFTAYLSLQAFISCSLGVRYVGFCIACLGVFTSSFSMIFGKLEKRFGIIAFFTYALFTHICLCVTMLVWIPDSKKAYVFFIMTGTWGSADGIYHTGIVGLLGYQFKEQKELAFASYRFMSFLLSVVPFSYSNYLCMKIKIYITIGMAGLSLSGCWYHRCRYSREYSHISKGDDVSKVNMLQEKSDY